MTRTLRGRTFVTGLLLLAVAVLSVPAFPAGKTAPLPADSLYQLSLPLTDQDGNSADWRTRRGKPQLLAMFYTSCQYICPLIVDSAKGIERQLDATQQKRLGILLISMDPKNDVPATLKTVIDKRKLDTRRWTLASPTEKDVRTLAGLLGVRYRKLADGGFNHTSALVLLDANGRILARTERMGSNPDPAFVAAVKKALRANQTSLAGVDWARAQRQNSKTKTNTSHRSGPSRQLPYHLDSQCP